MAAILHGHGVKTTVHCNYDGQRLDFLDENGKSLPSWGTYPVRIDKHQLDTLNKERILSIMQGSKGDLCPSSLAGLRPHEIVCESINTIDQLYHKSILTYQNSLATAWGEDQKNIRILSEEKKFEPLKIGVGGLVLGGVVGGLFSSALGLPAMIYYFSGGGALTGSIAGMFRGRHSAQQTIESEGSAWRFKWLYNVDLYEKERLEKSLICLHKATIPLIKDLMELQQHNQTDKLKIQQLTQLLRVHTALFPDIRLEVDLDPTKPHLINVAEYIETLKQTFSILDEGDSRNHGTH